MNPQNNRNKHTILFIYDTVLPELAQRINQHIAPVATLFNDFNLERLVDTFTKDPADETKEISIENGNVQQLGLKLRLEGFMRAGAGAFDMQKDLLFRLEPDSYTVGPDKNTTWLNKDYMQRWETAEYEMVASKWANELIDAVTERIESLTS